MCSPLRNNHDASEIFWNFIRSGRRLGISGISSQLSSCMPVDIRNLQQSRSVQAAIERLDYNESPRPEQFVESLDSYLRFNDGINIFCEKHDAVALNAAVTGWLDDDSNGDLLWPLIPGQRSGRPQYCSADGRDS